jgi:hypothetical protein
MPTDIQLKPEHLKAFDRLQSFLSDSPSPRRDVKSSVSSSSLQEGSIEIYQHKLAARRIPSGNDWRWNQAKGKKEAFLRQHNVHVILTKLIPRGRLPSCTDIPRYKLWHFAVVPSDGETPPYTVLWSEKGAVPVHPTQSLPHSSIPTSPPLAKHDLSYICN